MSEFEKWLFGVFIGSVVLALITLVGFMIWMMVTGNVG